MTAKEIHSKAQGLPENGHWTSVDLIQFEIAAQLADLNEALRSALTLKDLLPQKKKPGGPSLPLWRDPDLERPR